MTDTYCVYILTNDYGNTMYIGVLIEKVNPEWREIEA